MIKALIKKLIPQRLMNVIRSIDNLSTMRSDIINIKNDVSDIKFQSELFLDYFVNIKKVNNAVGDFRKHQLDNVQFLKKIIKLLNNNKIDYWLDCGTLLGAVRNNGFVPWDDDIDIGCFFKDYKKIIQILEEAFPHNKYRNKQDNNIQIYDGDCMIDIFIYKPVKEVKKAIRCEQFMNDTHELSPHYSRAFPEELLKPFKMAEYEGDLYNIPNDFDNYLMSRYGNYMRLPKKYHWHVQEKDNRKIFYPELEI